MPYNPGISYHGDQYIYGGLQNLGEGVQKLFQERAKEQEELAADQAIVELGRTMKNPVTGEPLMTTDMEHQWATGNAKQKAGIAQGITRTFALGMQAQQASALQEQRQAQAELRKQQADALNFQPRSVYVPPVANPQGIPYAQPVDIANQIQRPGGTQMIETRKGQFEPAGQLPSGLVGKVQITLPDGRQVWVTGDKAASMVTKSDPTLSAAVELDKKHGLTPEEVLNPNNVIFGDYDKKVGFIPGTGNYVNVNGQVMDSNKYKSFVRRLQPQHPAQTDTTQTQTEKTPKMAAIPDDVLKNAKDAISRGAPRAAVIQRLQQAGYDASEF